MEQIARVRSRERPCAFCGYDLRGASSARCPECGREMADAGRGRSRVPWVRRREVGRVRAYVQTVWMVLRRPWVIAAEATGPVERRAAVRFARISLALAAAMWVVVGLTALRNRMPIDVNPEETPIVLPVFALAGSFWVAVPLGLSAILSLWVALQWLRAIVARGTERVSRGRAWRASLYLAGLMPVFGLLFGLGVFGIDLAIYDEATRDGYLQLMCEAAAVLAIVAWLISVWVGMVLVVKWGRGKWLRGALMCVYLPGALFVSVVVTVIGYWICGFVAVAMESMTH